MNARQLKIAVQLSGHLRTYQVCAPYLKKHLLDLYDCDLFIHTWSQTEHTSQSWYDDGVRAAPTSVDDRTRKSINEIYSPKKIKIETQNFISEPGHFGTSDKIRISYQGLKYMLYGQNQVNRLRLEYEHETGVKYDYVVMTRPDIMPFEDLVFSNYEQEFRYYPKSSIHLIHNSEIHLVGKKFFNYPLAADVLYFSKPEIVNQITSHFEQYKYYFKDINSIFPKGVENPELAIFESLHQKGIIPRAYRFCFAIKRKNNRDDIKLLPEALDALPDGLNYCVSNKQIVKNWIKILTKPMVLFFIRWAPQSVLAPFRRMLGIAHRLDQFIAKQVG